MVRNELIFYCCFECLCPCTFHIFRKKREKKKKTAKRFACMRFIQFPFDAIIHTNNENALMVAQRMMRRYHICESNRSLRSEIKKKLRVLSVHFLQPLDRMDHASSNRRKSRRELVICCNATTYCA